MGKKKIYYIVLILIVLFMIVSYLLFNSVQNINLKATANSYFTLSNNGGNCYTVNAPSKATYWRVQVYYKEYSNKYFENNKILSFNHFNDKVISQKICFKKQKYNKEIFRILIKWTTGSNDKVYTKISPKVWMPSGFTYNNNIGWVYKDFNINWTTITKKINTNKTTTATKNANKISNGCKDDVIYNSNKYTLNDTQKKKLAAMIYQEYGYDLVGMKAVASHMANLYESRYKKNRSSSGFYNYITSTTWYAKQTRNATYSSSKSLALKAVEECIINGNRIFPTYIDEFDMFPNDIKNAKSINSYVKNATKVSNIYGSSGTFWCFTINKNGNGNIYFYTKK